MFVLSGASVLDLKTGKIPNLYILLCAALILIYRKSTETGRTEWGTMLVSALLPVIVLFPLFLVGFLGAGDLKCLMLHGLYGFTAREIFLIFFISLVFAAIIGICKLIKYRNFKSSYIRLYEYVKRLLPGLRNGSLSLSEISYIKGLDEQTLQKCGIKFSVPIAMGTMVYLWRCI